MSKHQKAIKVLESRIQVLYKYIVKINANYEKVEMTSDVIFLDSAKLNAELEINELKETIKQLICKKKVLK